MGLLTLLLFVFTAASATAPVMLESFGQDVYIKANFSRPGVNFGHAVALSGDGSTLAVGCPGDFSGATGVNGDPNNYTSPSGAVFVYTEMSGGWAQQAFIKASNTGRGDRFGHSHHSLCH